MSDDRTRIRQEERQQLALAVHDGVGQVLALTRLQLMRLSQQVDELPDESLRPLVQHLVNSLVPELDSALQAVQDLSFDLHLPNIDEVGLAGALELECKQFVQRTHVNCRYHFAPFSIEPDAGRLVVLIFREMLSNVARHSGATFVQASLEQRRERGILMVADKGRGIKAAEAMGSRAFGLRAMEQRARELDATLKIRGTDKGTSVLLSFPVRESRTVTRRRRRVRRQRPHLSVVTAS